MATYLSGIQPSGLPHLGNYFGAMRQHLALAQSEGEHFYFIADYHALTTIHDPEVLRTNVVEVAATYMALGLDEKALLFRQSDVPEVTELTWLLCTVTGMGLLERAHSYKDKVAMASSPPWGCSPIRSSWPRTFSPTIPISYPWGRTKSSTSRSPRTSPVPSTRASARSSCAPSRACPRGGPLREGPWGGR